MKVLATVCARGGSKGVRDKNIRDLNGRPLIAYTIQYLKKWGNADRIICSTDSEEIAKIAREYGAEVPFIRPKELATDDAAKLQVIKHALEFVEHQENDRYDIVVDLDPTAPLRKLNFIDEAFKKFIEGDANNLYTVCKSHKNPYFNMVEVDEKNHAHLCKRLDSECSSRQDAPMVYSMNASIYVFDGDFLKETDSIHSEKTIVYEMSDLYSIDIDREIDFLFIEFLLKNEVVKLEF